MWVSILFLRHCVDVEGWGCSVQCTGLFGAWDGYWNASYSVPWAPGGHLAAPPDPPSWGGTPPPQHPPTVHAYQAHELFAKAHGVGVVVFVDVGGIAVVKIQLWVTSKTMQVDWAIHYKQSLRKRWQFGKSHNVNLYKSKGVKWGNSSSPFYIYWRDAKSQVLKCSTGAMGFVVLVDL